MSIDGSEIVVRSRDTDEEFELEKAEWANAKYTLNEETKEIEETVEGVFRQYPVRLAWAITIHKSQGLTFEHAIIDASRSFSYGQTYVALSRCKSLEGMVLSAPFRLRPSSAVVPSSSSTVIWFLLLPRWFLPWSSSISCAASVSSSISAEYMQLTNC